MTRRRNASGKRTEAQQSYPHVLLFCLTCAGRLKKRHERLSAHGPGRVELLGNHTDYNEGVVLSAAISFAVTAQGEKRADGNVTLRSTFSPETVTLPLKELSRQEGATSWANYPLGVVHFLLEAGHPIDGFEMSLASDLPVGAGLSSSAALEVATAKLLMKLFALEIEPMPLAKLAAARKTIMSG